MSNRPAVSAFRSGVRPGSWPGVWLAVFALAGCPAPDAEFEPPVVDAAAAKDLTAATPPDLSPARCELPYDVRAIDKVATGAVTIMPLPTDPNVYTAEIDATAGGSMKYGENPFVYIDLIARNKVEITDVQAETNQGWDLGLKRWQVKLNSGDSGPAGVTVARVPGKNLGEVTMAPAGPYEADDYLDAKCVFAADPIGGLGTALSDWYDYESGTSRIVPKKEVLVLKRRDGQGHIKVQITSYYKGTTSANYSLSWSYLP